MSANLFGGGAAIQVNATGTLVPQIFAPTDGQSVFTLTLFSYTPNTNSLLVFINGVLQNPGTDYLETSTSVFTLTSAVTSNDVVKAIGFPLANFFQAGVGNNLTDVPTVAVVQASSYAWGGTGTGTPNAIVVATSPLPVSVAAGVCIRFIAGSTNTGAATLGIGTLTPLAIKKITNTGLADLAAGDLQIGGAYQVVHDGTYWQLSGGVGSGAATGGGVFYENNTTLNQNYTLTAGKNAVVVGPLTIATGKVLTIPTGQRLVIL